MPKDKGYPAGRKQNSVIVEVPKAKAKTNVSRRGIRRPAGR